MKGAPGGKPESPPAWGCDVATCSVDTQLTICVHLETKLFGDSHRNHPTRATWDEALRASQPYYSNETFDEDDFREFLAPYDLSEIEYGLLRDRYFVGLSGTTIAEDLGMPTSTVNAQINSIRKKLKAAGLKDIPRRGKK